MEYDPIYKHLEPTEVPLEKIFLDPNNPRFIGVHWNYIEDTDIIKDSVQQSITSRLVESYGIEKLQITWN